MTPKSKKAHTPLPALSNWFEFGDRSLVERAVRVLNDLKVTEFRTLFSWADWEREGGPAWFDYFVHEIGSKTNARLIPDLFYTPITLARKDSQGQTNTNHPPENLADYADFVGTMIDRYGEYFDWIQIWNEPNWKPYWDWDLDPDASLFSKMAIAAAKVAHVRGKKVALGGLSPYEPQWITRIHEHGLAQQLDAVGMNFSPSWDDQRRRWHGWNIEIETARAHLTGLNLHPEIWISEASVATDGNEHITTNAIAFFEETRHAPADKIIWFSIFDQRPDQPTDNELTEHYRKENAAYHMGLLTHNGREKELYRHWKAEIQEPMHE